ncbi:14426_t:CDS:1, partial [Dentiscutata erythropus]
MASDSSDKEVLVDSSNKEVLVDSSNKGILVDKMESNAPMEIDIPTDKAESDFW